MRILNEISEYVDINIYKNESYFGKTSDDIAEEIEEFIYSLIPRDVLEEKWTSNDNAYDHFSKHCISSTNRKSTKDNILYDFTDISEYEKYEKQLSKKIINTDNTISSLIDTETIFEELNNLLNKPTSILFFCSCGFKNSKGKFQVAFNSFANDVTKNYNSDTVDFVILTKDNRTITMFPIDVSLVEDKFNSIIHKYIKDRKIKKLYKKINLKR